MRASLQPVATIRCSRGAGVQHCSTGKGLAVFPAAYGASLFVYLKYREIAPMVRAAKTIPGGTERANRPNTPAIKTLKIVAVASHR